MSALSLTCIKGVGKKTAAVLSKLGIENVEQLLYYFPRKYQDRTKMVKIFELVDGCRQTFEGKVAGFRQRLLFRKRMHLMEVLIYDGTGFAHLLFFNQPNIKDYLPLGTNIVVSGRVYRRMGKIQVQDFEYEVLQKKERLHTTRIVPIYPLGAGLDRSFQRKMRSIMREAVLQYARRAKDILPSEMRKRYKLLHLKDALAQIHFPYSLQSLRSARRTIIFEELLLLQLALGIVKEQRRRREGIRFDTDAELPKKFLQTLPFSLTCAQSRVIQQIKEDMASPYPMHRLLHGEVGSGKTVVAIFAALVACANGYQVAFMAPTEVLAEQHFINLSEYLQPLFINLCCLTSSLKKRERVSALSGIREGKVHVVVGTHALLQEGVEFAKLGLCIIDEQHRFGVLQRKTLMEKGASPDTLIMTATPIPRTLALAFYGDLELSVLDTLPEGRRPAKTLCFSYKEIRRVYSFVKEKLKEGALCYFVYPQLEEEEGLRTAKGALLRLKREFHPSRVALLHGKIPADEKRAVMEAFKNKEVQLLCCTTVVEVGLDVEAATVIVVEEAHRFGLLQLHQLRGRVQRSNRQGYCLLLCPENIKKMIKSGALSEDEESLGARRIAAMLKTTDGFQIAEEDMRLRGPGELFGLAQHGVGGQLADILKHEKILLLARKEAESILRRDPLLHLREHATLREAVIKNYEGILQFARVG